MHIDTHAFEAVLKNRLQLRMNTEWTLTASKTDPVQHSNDTHELRWALCYLSFEEPALSSPVWTMFLSFHFSWIYRFGSHTWIEQSIDVHIVHYSEIFFWRGESTTLNTTTESPFALSKTCSTSSVVGAPLGRHSRLGSASSVLSFLNDVIILPHD